MMKSTFKQFLVESANNYHLKASSIAEAPLPDDWDKNTYNAHVPFAKRIRYAVERAQKLGTGSSRVAFEIPYNGRKTVLKVAKNKKGIAQNKFEAEVLSDHYIKSLGICIPIIDYDEENEDPTWLHVEYANKATASAFRTQCGGDVQDLIAWVEQALTGHHYFGDPTKINTESDLAQGLHQMIGNYDLTPVMDDLNTLANWGVYQGNLVIIDMGLSKDVYRTYYS